MSQTAATIGARSPDKAAQGASASSNGNVTKRLQSELMKLMMSSEKGISAFPDGDNLLEWGATIEGPTDTVRRTVACHARHRPSAVP